VIIIGGWVEVAAEERERYLEERKDKICRIRATAGCVDYVLSADPIEPDRVRVLEIWDNQAAQDARMAAQRDNPGPEPSVRLRSKSLTTYEVASSRPN
jgi:quinol monooxygenase YgiN